MFSKIKTLFDKTSQQQGGEAKSGAPKMEIAACAILLEMANIDGKFSDDEKRTILNILKIYLDMSDSDAESLLEESSKELSGSSGLWEFTNCINESLDHQEKIYLMELIWRVIYSDNSLDKYEDYLIHKLQNLLRLNHKEMIAAKLKIKKSITTQVV